MRRRPSSRSPAGGNSEAPTSEIDLWGQIVRSTVEDEFLSRNNLGLGNYSRREYWQQVESFRKGLYAEAAFARKLFDRAVYDTKCALARQEFERCVNAAELDGEGETEVKLGEESVTVATDGGCTTVRGLTLNQYIAEHGDRCWNELGSYEDDDLPEPQQAKLIALEEHAGLTSDWLSPFHRMIMVRHEASRSRFARLIDNAMGRVREIRGDADAAKVEKELGRH